jgi:hypothetical protein
MCKPVHLPRQAPATARLRTPLLSLALALLALVAAAVQQPARAQLVAPPQGVAQAGWRAASAAPLAPPARPAQAAPAPHAAQPRNSAPSRETRRPT